MAGYRGVVVFDVVGTLVGFKSWHVAIDEAIGDKLKSQNLTAQAFGHTWMTHAELEYTFLCLSERYTPYKQVMKATFYRTLGMMGVSGPRETFNDEDRDQCQAGYAQLQLRPGAKDCIAVLRDAGFDVWCLTTADLTRVQGYFASGGVEMPAEKFVSCDSTGVAKPVLAAYRPILEKCRTVGEAWFAAGHMWDVAAARKTGFKGAYCSIYEKEDCLDIHGGEMDVMAAELPEMARKIVSSSSL
ncbi:2-haloalkanoic acid dehalogenase [Hortaea werneckii]|nr:2-haloalkanoic acid dehalogenase [Hortaea werneckii]